MALQAWLWFLLYSQISESNSLEVLYKELPNLKVSVSKELTKLHEDIRYSSILEQINVIEAEGIKGEIVLIVKGNEFGDKEKKEEETRSNGYDLLSDKELVEKYISLGIDKKEAIKKVAKERRKTKNEVYMECI